MVAFVRAIIRRTVWIIPAVGFFACDLLPGYYNDYDSRFAWRDEFVFLAPAGRSPDLGTVYSFIVVSDTHIGDQAAADRFAHIQDILEPGDKFIVITGDISDNGTREELALFVDAARSLPVPCYPVLGNHDIYTGRGTPWRELIGSTLYRVDSPGTTLFFLDNANAALGHEQLTWLEDGFETAEQNTFVFAHENLFTVASPPDIEQITDIRERAVLMALLENRCRIMFTGHLHRRILREAGGVSYLALENYGEKGVFCRVYVSDGAVSWEIDQVF